jgi:hypothetical protein
MDYPSRPNITTKVLNSGRGKQKTSESIRGRLLREKGKREERCTWPCGRDLDTGVEDSRRQSDKETDSFPEPLGKNTTLVTPGFQPNETHIHTLLIHRIVKSQFVLFQLRGLCIAAIGHKHPRQRGDP